jgi:hypothetical protein
MPYLHAPAMHRAAQVRCPKGDDAVDDGGYDKEVTRTLALPSLMSLRIPRNGLKDGMQGDEGALGLGVRDIGVHNGVPISVAGHGACPPNLPTTPVGHAGTLTQHATPRPAPQPTPG